jgi:hypothetical protein
LLYALEVLRRLKPQQSIESATAALRAVQPQIRTAAIPPRSIAKADARESAGGMTLFQLACELR